MGGADEELPDFDEEEEAAPAAEEAYVSNYGMFSVPTMPFGGASPLLVQ